MPTVSIITPVYNPVREFWERSKNSILNQTEKDFEWILVDDGSSEGLEIEYDVVLSRNFGPSVARNCGVQISSGKIITYLDLGDELDPRRVENLIDTFGKWKLDILFSAYDIVEQGFTHRFDHFTWLGKSPRFPDAITYLHLLEKRNIAIPLGVAHTRKPFIEVGGFQRGIVCGEDGILWRRMVNRIHKDRILFSDDFAGTYHVNPNGQSRTQKRFEMGGFAFDGRMNDNGKYLDEKWFNTYSSEELYD